MSRLARSSAVWIFASCSFTAASWRLSSSTWASCCADSSFCRARSPVPCRARPTAGHSFSSCAFSACNAAMSAPRRSAFWRAAVELTAHRVALAVTVPSEAASSFTLASRRRLLSCASDSDLPIRELGVERIQRAVLAGQGRTARTGRWRRSAHEHHHHDQRGEGVDEAGPDVQRLPTAARRASACGCLSASVHHRAAAIAVEGIGDGARQQRSSLRKSSLQRRTGSRLRARVSSAVAQLFVGLGRVVPLARIAAEQIGQPRELVLSSDSCSLAPRRSRSFSTRRAAGVPGRPRSAQQGLHIGGHAGLALELGTATELVARQPFLQLVVEAVLRRPRLQARKPTTRELARPNSEVEKLVDMPRSGSRRCPQLGEHGQRTLPPPSVPMMSETEAMVASRPQKVPSRPRKMARPMR